MHSKPEEKPAPARPMDKTRTQGGEQDIEMQALNQQTEIQLEMQSQKQPSASVAQNQKNKRSAGEGKSLLPPAAERKHIAKQDAELKGIEVDYADGLQSTMTKEIDRP